MNLIVGLGNSGLFYAHNRHNIGFMCLNHLARVHSIRFAKKQGLARVGTGKISSNEVILARPQTFMNISGESVSRLVRKFNIDLNNLLIIYDDLDLPQGKIRIRKDGSSGGHKGLDSIITHLGSRGFPRIRVGIGRPDIIEGSMEDKEAAIVKYVLSNFTSSEKIIIRRVIPEVSDAIHCLLKEGLTAAMNKYN